MSQFESGPSARAGRAGRLGAGLAYTVVRGIDAKGQVRDELEAQKIVTTDDASIPGVPVVDAATAESMADIIGVHAEEATGGRTYAELGRFLTPDGGDTSDEAEALEDEAGNPVANPLRSVAFQASASGPACTPRCSRSTSPTS